MGFYIKRPVTVEAQRLGADSVAGIANWINENGGVATVAIHANSHLSLEIDTLEGTMVASAGDWIIRGVKGEFYPCKDDIFQQTYEKSRFNAYSLVHPGSLETPPGLVIPKNAEVPEGLVEVLVFVTPAFAKDLLDANVNNRRKKHRKVQMFASDMLAGQWRYTGAPILVAKDGRLLDGQHRLSAIEESGVTVPMKIIYGFPPEVQENVDLGTPRSAADNLFIGKEDYSSNLAAAAKVAITLQDGRLFRGNTIPPVSVPEVTRFVQENPELREAVKASYKIGSALATRRPAIVAAVYWWLDSKDPENNRAYWEKVTSGVGLKEGDPILALHSRLRQVALKHERVEPRQLVNFILRNFVHWRAGNKIAKQPMPQAGEKLLEL